MKLNFRKYFEQNTVGYHNDGFSGHHHHGNAWMTSDQTGSEQKGDFLGSPPHLPSHDLKLADVPTINKKAVIRLIEKNKNPIRILLGDGTNLFFSYDEFKRIKGPMPEVGRTMSVTFQRFPQDKSQNTSQVQDCEVF